ncbi:hypothetical protein [Flavobacterium sp. SM2513]|uniref:hypothetical protein n=1 Tax=Flavobacterium sp. SM2513 TaxID=3424766 RepID=UPI003D7F8F27
MINSRYFLVDGIYRKNDWNFFDSLPRLFTEDAYREDIIFYSFLYIIFFYALAFIFFKDKNRMKSNLIGVAFVLFFPIISIGNNLYNYKDESAKESRAWMY